MSYIHKNLALRWLWVTNDFHHVTLKEHTLKSELDPIIAEIEALNIEFVGVSVYIFNHLKSKVFIKQLKARLPHVQVIVGGPEVTYTPETWLAYGCDFVVQGDGEFAFWDLVKGKDVPGVSTRKKHDPLIIRTQPSLLEQYPNPYFLDFDSHDAHHRYLYVEASRGCPFHCTYCVAGIDHGVYTFSLPYMMKVIDLIGKSKVKQVKFLDRTFNTNVKRALQMIQALNDIDRDLAVQLEVEVSIWDDALNEFFKHHGKRNRFRFEVGVQTFNETTLKLIKRKQNNKKVEEVIAALTNDGYVVHADLIAGLPKDTYLQFSQSFTRLLRLFPSEIQLGILKGLPGTALKIQAQQHDIEFDALPPYAIQTSDSLSAAEIRKLELAALGVDKIYNKPRAKSLIKALMTQKVDMLEYFYRIGHRIAQLKQPYQIKDMMNLIIAQTTSLPKDEVIAYLANDLGKQSKMRVRDLPYCEFNQQDIKSMQDDISQRLSQDPSQWKSNSWVYLAMIDGKMGYQWIVYPQKKRYYYLKGAIYVREADHLVGNA